MISKFSVLLFSLIYKSLEAFLIASNARESIVVATESSDTSCSEDALAE